MTSGDILDKANYLHDYTHTHHWAGDDNVLEYKGHVFTPSQQQRQLFQSIDTSNIYDPSYPYAMPDGTRPTPKYIHEDDHKTNSAQQL